MDLDANNYLFIHDRNEVCDDHWEQVIAVLAVLAYVVHRLIKIECHCYSLEEKILRHLEDNNSSSRTDTHTIPFEYEFSPKSTYK